jgi:hypothetical protein
MFRQTASFCVPLAAITIALAPLSGLAAASNSKLVTDSIAVDCGGEGGFSLTDGFFYVADCVWPECVDHGHTGGSPHAYETPDYLFSNGPRRDAKILLNENQGIESHSFQVAAGFWELSMRFVETDFDGPGLRVQRVVANGKVLIDSLDIYAQVGKARMLDLRRILETDGDPLVLAFDGLTGSTDIAGISLRALPDEAPDEPLPPVDQLQVEPALGAALVHWNTAPCDARADGYLVLVTDSDNDTLWSEHRYTAWARVPSGPDLLCSVSALAADGTPGISATISGLTELAPDTLPEEIFYLDIAAEDLSAMEAALHEKEKLRRPGTLRTRDSEPCDGEVHFRGATSLRDPKKSFKFRIDEGELRDQYRRVNLVAAFQDRTVLHEVLAARSLENAGIGTYHATPCAVVVNGYPYGLFQQIEEPDERFLERLGLDPNGRAYKINCDLTPTTEQLWPLWCYENLNATDWLRDDINHLILELNSCPLPDQETFLHENFDIDQVIDWYCGMVYVSNSDMSTHNFIMYRPREGGRWQLYPWDMDGTWGDTEMGADISTRDNPDFTSHYNRVADLLMQQPRLKLRYLRRLSSLLDGPLSTAEISAIASDLTTQSMAVGLADPHKKNREKNTDYLTQLNHLINSPALRDTALRASIAELMPPWWVDLSINEIALTPGPSSVEITSQAPQAVELGGLYLSDDPNNLLKWPLDNQTLDPGAFAAIPLPPEAATARWLCLATARGAIVDSTRVPTPGRGPAVGRYPDGYGRIRVLQEDSIGEPNSWETPVTLNAGANHEALRRGQTVRVVFEAENSWRNSLTMKIVVSSEAENGLRQAGPPLHTVVFRNLGPGESEQDEFTLEVPEAHRHVLDGRNDLIFTAYEAVTGDRLATTRLPLFVVGDAKVPLLLNEICTKNSSIVADEAGEFEDWVEVINPSVDPVQLSAYFLTDDLEDEPFRWNFPEQILGPNERVLVWLDKDLDQGLFHAPFKLKQDGEELALVKEVEGSPEEIDYLPFGYIEEDQSIGRYPDGTVAWERFPIPTPNQVNLDPLF